MHPTSPLDARDLTARASAHAGVSAEAVDCGGANEMGVEVDRAVAQLLECDRVWEIPDGVRFAGIRRFIVKVLSPVACRDAALRDAQAAVITALAEQDRALEHRIEVLERRNEMSGADDRSRGATS